MERTGSQSTLSVAEVGQSHRYRFLRVAFAGSRPLSNQDPNQSAGGSLWLLLPSALACPKNIERPKEITDGRARKPPH
jgi:hypothetical protein